MAQRETYVWFESTLVLLCPERNLKIPGTAGGGGFRSGGPVERGRNAPHQKWHPASLANFGGHIRRALLTPYVVPPYNNNRGAATQGGRTQSPWVE